MKKTDIAVIGGGAAGLMAAGRAASLGARVLLLEQNEKIGRKIGITGKGRCNVTNACDLRTFMDQVVTNGRFLYSALNRLDPAGMMALLEKEGVPLKTERGSRVFPVSDCSFDIVDALGRYARQNGGRLMTGTAVRSIRPTGEGFCLDTDGETVEARRVILATGGKSYSVTGSRGDGLTWAAQLGHAIVDCRPGLIPLTVQEDWVPELMGLSLKNTALYFETGGKKIYEDFGEMLFTHFGVSGPMILSGSSRLQQYLRRKGLTWKEAGIRLHLDLKSALSAEELDRRLIREMEAAPGKSFRNFLGTLLPQKLIGVFIRLTGIPAERRAADLDREERKNLGRLLKDLVITVTGTRPLEEAIITMGGVAVKEVDPGTMESKKCPGLFLAGELLDVDALTGGFNLQIAFSTGYAAGEGAARSCGCEPEKK